MSAFNVFIISGCKSITSSFPCCYELRFKHADPKNFTIQNSMGQLLVQALTELGKDGITPEIVHMLQAKLTEAQKKIILRESRYVPVWIYDLIQEIMK